jgi:hypothetical protein
MDTTDDSSMTLDSLTLRSANTWKMMLESIHVVISMLHEHELKIFKLENLDLYDRLGMITEVFHLGMTTLWDNKDTLKNTMNVEVEIEEWIMLMIGT